MEHGSITKTLGIAVNDYDAGRITEQHLLSILQSAIDNGDVLLEENKFYTVSVIFPFLDRGILRPSQYTKEFEQRMDIKVTARAAELRKK